MAWLGILNFESAFVFGSSESPSVKWNICYETQKFISPLDKCGGVVAAERKYASQ